MTFTWPCIVTNFFTINQLDALMSQIYFGRQLYMFRTVALSIIRVFFSLYTQQWYMSYRFADNLRAGFGWNSVPSWSCLQDTLWETDNGNDSIFPRMLKEVNKRGIDSVIIWQCNSGTVKNVVFGKWVKGTVLTNMLWFEYFGNILRVLNWIELNWIELNWIELNWIELNWIELN